MRSRRHGPPELDPFASRAPERDNGRVRPLEHGDLRLLLLALIEQQPRHGYELMQQIGALFKGLYAPSAGAIYPALAQLETDGLVQADLQQGRKRHHLSAAGRRYASEHRDALDAALARSQQRARALIKAQTPAPIREAIHRIKHGLFARHGQWSDAETARIATLLNAAADAMGQDDE
ncbi:PadR family transcriptional regulator [Xanthomonas codiaei]|uniref:PadR family transcriptional regulator n=1 Tax=Xanthomonas codiaei TaxID=56463 RepID=A0A2S7CDR7_9XANT|nr:PadR family transcriptional regulator [Xanthomonas codiaei]PPU59695.1 PadR family transcriptional regulator [Xanthomonas codiaei]